ncbi:MAG: DNA oxidative demethylase AlkB [Marinobacter sp.]|uniref:DNA oxidative demethylase AlkB n=1 Tax=Marinobacter sp. TaxID=50741 RepID=UPI00299DDBB5|nr:DNA oxidative demethylase AlkB [Marinobacter sp.]MDX1754580.1 DNA oxidative demethylase AlkB [Marinobacter sp.]
MTPDLFDQNSAVAAVLALADGAVVLRRFALGRAEALVRHIETVQSQAAFRQMKTPGGYTMSAAMTNCGRLGWVTDRTGYRYQSTDPQSGEPWPAMPALFSRLAGDAACAAGFDEFAPDACLINRYRPGARMSLHQDKNERDFGQPIVSVSLGLPVVFQFGGLRRNDRPQRVLLEHGDVVVWGGPSRLRYHGVLALKPGQHPLTGECRFNLTLRRAD